MRKVMKLKNKENDLDKRMCMVPFIILNWLDMHVIFYSCIVDGFPVTKSHKV